MRNRSWWTWPDSGARYGALPALDRPRQRVTAPVPRVPRPTPDSWVFGVGSGIEHLPTPQRAAS